MQDKHYRWKGVLLASITAGPVFLIAGFLADYCLRIPEAVTVDSRAILVLPVMLLVTSAFGFFIAFLPTIVGAALMAAIAERFEAARPPIIWALAGAAIGTIFVSRVDVDQPALAFAIVIASASSARLSRMSLVWRRSA